jgi:hypothetical protein
VKRNVKNADMVQGLGKRHIENVNDDEGGERWRMMLMNEALCLIRRRSRITDIKALLRLSCFDMRDNEQHV